MVLRDSDHCFGTFSGYSLAVRFTETSGNRDDLTDFCLVLRAGTKADLEESFRGRSSGPYGCFAAWRTGRKFYWKRYLNRSVGKSDLNEKNMRAHEKGTLTRGCLHFISLSCKRRIKLSQRDRILSRKCIHTSCGSRR